MTRGGEAFIPFAVPDITDAEVTAAAEAVRSGWLTTGPQTAAFEKEFAAFIGADVEAVAVNSATAGLHLALEALGIGPGDEVIVPTWTFTASAEVVRYLGADPVLVDVDAVTLNIDFRAAESAVSPRTKAIMPVHFAGLAVPVSDIQNFARRHSIEVIEDAAHAIPSTSGGITVGASDSAATVFSFYATKTMATGEGGMLVTHDRDLATRARTMRLHGINRDVFGRYQSTTPSWQYEVVAPGYKYNMADPAAAIGRVQLARVEQMARERHSIALRYDEAFRDLGLELPPHPAAGDIHARHLYVVRLGVGHGISRDEFVAGLAARGVGTSVHFIPLHQQPYWRERYNLDNQQFPVATREFERVVSLPIFSSMTSLQIERVIDAVHSVLGVS